MFGIWRTLLALEVIFYHLAGIPVIGTIAVFSFFVLSGFLMTTIMQQTYGYTVSGILRYAANRALRLFPSYWFAIAWSVLVILIVGASAAAAYKSDLALPATPAGWIENLTLVFAAKVPMFVTPRLSPPTWALTIELFFYVLIGLGISSTPRRALIWLAASIVYTAAMFATHDGRGLYGGLLCGSLPFASGACLYHFREPLHALTSRLPRWVVALVFLGRYGAAIAALLAFHFTGFASGRDAANLVNIVLSGILILEMFNLPKSIGRDSRWRRIDRRIGDFSYPFYLLHWQTAAFVSLIVFKKLGTGLSLGSLIVLLATFPLLLLLSAICVFGIDPAVEKVRSRLRARGNRRKAPAAVASGLDPP